MNARGAAGRWQEIKQVLAEALERDPDGRKALLDDVRTSDPELAREVWSLLGWSESPDGLRTSPEGSGSRPPLAEGDRLGAYEIRELIQSGGMGSVYRARDTRLDREVAVKVLTVDGHGRVETLLRFEREARTVAALSHPNILSIFDYGSQGDVTYAVTELLLGESLRSRLRAGPLPVTEALRLAHQIARGLAAAHAKGIVHRDLKPENIFLAKDGTCKILDFGLAKRTWPLAALDPSGPEALETRAGMILGTVGYMAPEQVRGQAADTRADVFAFGVLFYEMLTGRRPFDRETPAETLAAVLRDDVPACDPARVSPSLARLLGRCMAKDRDARPPSAQEVLKVIDGLATSDSGAGSRVTRRLVLAAALTAALIAGGSAVPWTIVNARAVDLIIPVGKRPSALALGGGNLWVANRESNSITRIRLEDGRVTGTFPVGEWPVALAFDGQSVWVANHKWLPGEYATLMKVDPTDGRILGTFRLAGQPVNLSTDGNFIWVAETWPTYQLHKRRVSDGGEVATFTAGGIPRETATDGQAVWISNGAIGSLTKIRASDGKLLGALAVEGVPTILRRIENDLWLDNNHPKASENALLRIKGDDLAVLGRFATPEGNVLAVSPRWFFVAEPGRIIQRRSSDGAVVASWAGGPRPTVILFDGVNLWTADDEANQVTMISGRRLAAPDAM